MNGENLKLDINVLQVSIVIIQSLRIKKHKIRIVGNIFKIFNLQKYAISTVVNNVTALYNFKKEGMLCILWQH